MALTIYDIAKEAGVSITTVSRVLNGKGEISRSTKEKIQAVLDRHAYTPSQLARGLASRESKTIGILVLDLRVEHYAALVHETESAFSLAGYSSIVCSLAGKPDRLGFYLEMLLRRKVDGMVFTGSVFSASPYREIILSSVRDVPSVMLNASLPADHFYGVINDEFNAFREAVIFLHKKKKRNHIVLLGGISTPGEDEKVRGYLQGIKECRLKDGPVTVKADHTIDSGRQAAEKILAERPDTDAFLCTVDMIAAGAVHILNERKIPVPGQISVIGADNSLVSVACYPTLTTVDVQTDKTGGKAAELLVAAIRGEEPVREAVLPCRLIERSST